MGSADLRPRPVSQWACPRCGEVAWGCAEQREYWKTIHKCKGDDVTQTMQEKIAAAKARAKAAAEKVAALEAQAAEGPKRQKNRSVTEVREIMLVEVQMKERYGVGYPGLSEIVRKARKEGIAPVAATGQNVGVTTTGQGAVPPPPPRPEADPLPAETPARAGEVPDAVAPDEPEPQYDPADDPPPELAPAPEAEKAAEVPW